MVSDQRPSVRRRLRTALPALAVEHGVAQLVTSADAKPDGGSSAESLGVRVPELLLEPTKLDEAPFDTLPDEGIRSGFSDLRLPDSEVC